MSQIVLGDSSGAGSSHYVKLPDDGKTAEKTGAAFSGYQSNLPNNSQDTSSINTRASHAHQAGNRAWNEKTIMRPIFIISKQKIYTKNYRKILQPSTIWFKYITI